MMRVGVVLNPIAGFGGALALHGTDTLPADRFDEAVRAGRAARRLLHAIERFQDVPTNTELVVAPGLLGADQLTAAGIPHRTWNTTAPPTQTDRNDTMAAAQSLLANGVTVLLFAGGDGTATDIATAVGTGIPVIGVPAGVKMHSEVFTRSPASAGRLLADFVAGCTRSEPAEVLDVRSDGISTVVGTLTVPRSREALQGAKRSVRSPASGSARHAIALSLLTDTSADITWIIGPGNTAGAVAEGLGFVPTLRGVDVRHPTGSVEQDVAEERLYRIADEAARPRLVLGVVGGQGFLLGRGNQQISSRVIERVGAERVDIVATADKIGGLVPAILFVDLDGADALLGYRRVRTGVGQSTVMKVVNAAV